VLFEVVFIVAGAAVLVMAADRLVSSSSEIASRIGVSPIVVGAVIIGFGSSLPEMLVSVAALDQPNGLDLAIGNVVGSNIANIGLVLGFSILLFPFAGPSAVVKREGALTLAAMILMSTFVWDQELQLWEGLTLLAALAAAGFIVVVWSRSSPESTDTPASSGRSLARLNVVAAISLVALAASARVLVLGAEGLATRFGLSEGLVGLTILALGTSLPELGAVVASARRGQNDLVLGNVLGSNLFNALGVAGISGTLGAGALATDFDADLVVMVVIALFAGFAAWTGNRYRRVEGLVLLSAYPLAIWYTL
jgi:cation:H+ antiporter